MPNNDAFKLVVCLIKRNIKHVNMLQNGDQQLYIDIVGVAIKMSH